jgi:hypothetical protein
MDDRRLAVLLVLVLACGDDDVPDPAVDAGPGSDAAAATSFDSGAPGPDGGLDPADAQVSEPDASIPDGRIPIFIAQGMVGRTTISCDDGRSWVGDRAWDREDDAHLCGSSDVVCFAEGGSCSQRWYDGTCSDESPCDCGHSPGFSKGVVYADDYFVATWGWGWPGSVRRSRNGIDWETTLDGNSFGGIAYGAGRLVLAARDNFWSTDSQTWMPGATADFSGPSEPVIWSVRRFGYADYEGGRFVAIASGNTDRDILVSSDGGETWWRPSVIPPDCGSGVDSYGGIVYGNGVIALIGGSGACRSTDGGQTWSMTTLTEGDEIFVATPVFTGTEFWAWTHYGHVMMRSEDAASWTETPMATPTGLGAVGRNPETGTLVAVDSVWSGYGDLEFLRSTDGLTWEALPEGAFAPGHPIFHIAFGYAERSAACP